MDKKGLYKMYLSWTDDHEDEAREAYEASRDESLCQALYDDDLRDRDRENAHEYDQAEIAAEEERLADFNSEREVDWL